VVIFDGIEKMNTVNIFSDDPKEKEKKISYENDILEMFNTFDLEFNLQDYSKTMKY
jgi:hypothetical protein